MEPHKQIKAVAQTYLQEQQLREQKKYIEVLENTVTVIAEQMGVEPDELIEWSNDPNKGFFGNLAANVGADAKAAGKGLAAAGAAAGRGLAKIFKKGKDNIGADLRASAAGAERLAGDVASDIDVKRGTPLTDRPDRKSLRNLDPEVRNSPNRVPMDKDL